MSDFSTQSIESGQPSRQRPGVERARKSFDQLLVESARFEGGIGAVAWAALEMLKRGGLEGEALGHFKDQLLTCLARSPEESRDCEEVLAVLRRRLDAEFPAN